MDLNEIGNEKEDDRKSYEKEKKEKEKGGKELDWVVLRRKGRGKMMRSKEKKKKKDELGKEMIKIKKIKDEKGILMEIKKG